MTKKEKEEHLDHLSDCVQIEAQIDCEGVGCRNFECDYDEIETAQKAFAEGWRYIDGRALCPKCVKKEKKK